MEIFIMAMHINLLTFLGLLKNGALPNALFCCRQWLVTLFIFPHLGLKDGSYEQYRYFFFKVKLLCLSTTLMLKE